MCGLDVTNQAILAPEYLATLPTLNRTGKMLHALFSHYRSGSMESGLRMHDLCAIAWLVRPELFTLKSCFVAVETQGSWTAGTTVVDIEAALASRPTPAWRWIWTSQASSAGSRRFWRWRHRPFSGDKFSR
nr:inosine-uridine preferring nucleoside hydrolase [Raoultella sp. NCTC 9187]